MAALYIAGTWVHVEPFGYVWFVYPAVAVWCFDRLVRIGRLIAFGFPKAEITLLANDTLKLSFQNQAIGSLFQVAMLSSILSNQLTSGSPILSHLLILQTTRTLFCIVRSRVVSHTVYTNYWPNNLARPQE